MKKPAHTWTDPATGHLYALFTYTTRLGKRKYVKRKARNASHAKELYKAMEKELAERGQESFDGDRMTFNQLAQFVKTHYVKEPTFVNGLKVSGMRSWKDARQKLDVMCGYFGTRKIKSLNPEDIEAYRDLRLKTATKRRGKPRSLASVQRELSLLRRVLNVARRKRWIAFSPFAEGGFISNASEVPRTRVISRSEEVLLLAACEMEDRAKKKSLAHLRPVYICGVDTGMRSGEMFKLLRCHVELDADRIKVIASHTKNEEERYVPITPRLKVEMEKLLLQSDDPEALVFGIKRIKRGWVSLCKKAGVFGVTPHDMRHTAATRMIKQGIPLAEVSRILGHSSIQTTYRYINQTDEMIGRAGAALDAFHSEEEREAIH